MANIALGPKLGQLIDANIGDYYPDAFRAFLRSYDALVQGSVIDVSMTTPPSSPNDGDAYIVPAGATGAWTSQVNNVAVYSTQIDSSGTNTAAPGWEFHTPNAGWMFYVTATSSYYTFNGTNWAASSSGYPGVTSDGNNGLIVTGSVAVGGTSYFGPSDSGQFVQSPANNVFYANSGTTLSVEAANRSGGIVALNAIANGQQANNTLQVYASAGSGSGSLASNQFSATTDGSGITNGNIYGAFVSSSVRGGDSIYSMTGVHVELDVGGGTITDHASALEINAYPQGCPTYAINVLQGDTRLGGHLISTTADNAGTVTIANPNTSEAVPFAQSFMGTNPPVVTVSAVGNDPTQLGGVWITYQGSAGAWTGFTINVTTAPVSTATFNYTIIGLP